MTAEIRLATAEDVPTLAMLEQELVRTDAPGDPYLVRTKTLQELEAHYREVLTRDWGLCLVAAQDGELVGYLTGSTTDSPDWRPVTATEIHALFVKEPFRSQGIGTRLVDAFVHWSRERGVEVVELGAFASNARALQFYQRAGFRPTLVHLELPLHTTTTD